MTGGRARQRNYYCSAKRQAIITRRAKAAGMSRSAFIVACALHDEPAGAETLPAADDGEALLGHLSATAGMAERLMAPAPDLGMSVLDALALLCRMETPEADS